MNHKNLLFLTNFSEACFQAVPAIAEWIDREDGQLTIVHVARPEGRQVAIARDRLNSFFAEADRYRNCRRSLLIGSPLEEVAHYCRSERPDAVFAPASKPSGVPRPFHQSLRARLVRDGGIKLWTRGRGDGTGCSLRTPRNVAYVVTGHPGWITEACEAARLAVSYGANLHYLYLTPWPEVHDGTVADLRSIRPQVPPQELENLARRLPIRPELHTALGDSASDVVRILRECQADVAFVAEHHAVRRGLFRVTMDSDLDRLDCEVICYPKSPISRDPLALQSRVTRFELQGA